MSAVENWANRQNISNTAGGLRQVGTSAAPLTLNVPGMAFDKRYYSNLATSGEAIARYERLYVSGAGGEGIAARFFTTVNNVAGANARGAHISLSFGASGSITGLGAALEVTLHIPTTAGLAGTCTALKVAINSDGAASDPVGVTELSFIRIENQGDATGGADVDDDAVAFSFQGFTAGTGNVIMDITDGAALVSDGSIRIKIGSAIRYLYYYDNEAT